MPNPFGGGAGPMPAQAGGPLPDMGGATKDPVMEVIDRIQADLDELRTALGGEEQAEAPAEMMPQSDHEVMAGLPPQPKKPVGMFGG